MAEPVEARRSLSARPPMAAHRSADLDVIQRAVFASVLVLLVAVPVTTAIVVLVQGWVPAGDNALIGLRIRDVLRGAWPLIGQPTPGESFGSGVETSHPGPLAFYLMAPFVLVLGSTWGLAVSAAAINAAAMVGSALLAFRRGGLDLMVIVAVAVLALSRSLGGNFLHDPVSSQVGTTAAIMTMFAAWCVLAGDVRVVPVFVFVASFTLQDHLTYLGTSVAVVVAGLAAAVAWIDRFRRRPRFRAATHRLLGSSVVVGVVLWLPVLVDELFGSHNLNAIWRTFTGGRTPGEGLLFAVQRLAEALAPMPIFTRRVPPLGYLHTPSPFELTSGLIVALALISVVMWAHVVRDRELRSMGLVGVIAMLTGVYAAVKLPDGAGIQASNLRWMWTVSLFVWVVLIWTGWSRLREPVRGFLRPPLGILGAIGAVVLVAGLLSTTGVATSRDGKLMRGGLEELLDDVDRALPDGRYRVTFSGGTVVVSVGPALVYHLEVNGTWSYLDIGPFTRAYTDDRSYEGQPVDGTILITDNPLEDPDGSRELGRREFEINRKDSPTALVRVLLIPGEP